MEIVLIYESRYFKNFEKYLVKKSQKSRLSVDFDQTLTLCKIREEKGEKIVKKLYFF